MKKLAKFFFSRLVVGILVLFLQIYWFVAIVFQIGEHNDILSFILKAFSIVVVIYIINKDDNPAYKLAWVIPILTVPILGGIMYLYLGNKKPSRRLRKVLDQEFKDTAFLLMQKKEIL